jgi:RNA polymerase sigma-70 factor (ECF subfamily)
MRSATTAGHGIADPAHVTTDMHVSAALGIADPADGSVDGPVAGPSNGPIAGPSDGPIDGSIACPSEDLDRLATETPEILALIQDGRHRDAVAACARAHGAVLGRLCMALLGSQADADEATQETLLRAHRGMATYRGEGSVKAWLCGIARHVCVHMLESRQRGRDVLERAAILDEPVVEPFASQHRARAIRRALDQLRPSAREALVLRYVADLGHRDIAATLHIDEAAARKRISRALGHLRAVLCDQEIER